MPLMKRWHLILFGLAGLFLIVSLTKTGRKIVTETFKSITGLGINLVRRLEGFSDTVYPDQAGLWTIGYGHKVIAGDPYYPNTNEKTISENDAVNLLAQDMETAANVVRKYVTVPLNEQQFNSLVSFVFNTSSKDENIFASSTLLKKLNDSNYEGAANELDKWVHIHDHSGNVVVSDGLIARREQEKNLFLS